MSDIARWIATLASPEADQRAEAAAELARLGPDAAIALTWACGDESEEVRKRAVAGLEGLGPPRLVDVRRLIDLLTDLNPDVAYWAATLLGRLGVGAASAIPALESALANAPMAVRRGAAWALGEIGPSAVSALAALRQVATGDDVCLAQLASHAIDRITG